MNKSAPIALFVYSRLAHTRCTLEALASNELAAQTPLFVFSDAPRSNKDLEAVQAVREYLKTINGFGQIHIIERPYNYGLADSIVDGVGYLMERFGRAIIVEDDIICSPYFLRYMNEALDRYAEDERVMHVAGYVPAIITKDLPESFFLRQSSCWGWASWARAWKWFSRDGSRFIKSFSQEDIHRFNLDGTYDYWGQLIANEQGKIKTWAIYWYATVFSKHGLCLHPRESLVDNIGFDGSGENCGNVKELVVRLAKTPVRSFPDYTENSVEDMKAATYYQRYLQTNGKPHCHSEFWNKTIDFIRRKFCTKK